MKPCGRCKKFLTEDHFRPSAWRSGGYCRPCWNEWMRQWRARNPIKHNKDAAERQRQWRLRNPLLAKERARNYCRRIKERAFAVLGDRCECCGETEPRFLQIDHVNNDGAAHRRALGMRRHGREPKAIMGAFYREVARGKTDGLQLLCANCNWGKARNGGTCPHEEERMAVALLVA